MQRTSSSHSLLRPGPHRDRPLRVLGRGALPGVIGTVGNPGGRRPPVPVSPAWVLLLVVLAAPFLLLHLRQSTNTMSGVMT